MTSKKSPQVTPKPTQKSRKIKPLKSKEPRTPKELAPELKEKLLSATIENHEDLHFITPKRLDQPEFPRGNYSHPRRALISGVGT